MDIPYKRAITNYSRKYDTLNGIFSFLVGDPILLYYCWANLGLTKDQFITFIIIGGSCIVFGLITSRVSDIIFIAPVQRYFKKLLNDEPVSEEIYIRAKRRFFRLPYLHAFAVFLHWLILLSVAVIISDHVLAFSIPQHVNLWIGVAVYIPLMTVVDFCLQEIELQRLLNRGVFSEWSGKVSPGRFPLRRRLYMLIYLASLLPFFGVSMLLYITLENLGLGNWIWYAKLGAWLFLVLLLSSTLVIVINRVITDKIRIIIHFLERIGKGELDGDKQEILISDEISYINNAVFSMKENLRLARDELRELNFSLEQKVEERTEELQAAMEELAGTNEMLREARDALWGEMELAKKIQTVLLPREPAVPGFDISAYMEPAEAVGGDYYDIINADERDWVVIGDVSGHGVPAGLVMMMAQTAIQTLLRENPRVTPSRLLEVVNRSLTYNVTQMADDKYMTITALAINRDGSVIFSGLHLDIFVYRAASGTVEVVETDGVWLGLDIDTGRENTDKSFSIESGDAMLLYTDGIIEAKREGGDGEMFGQERLKTMLLRNGSLRPENIRDAILSELKGYKCKDDVTMVIVKRV